MTMYSLQIVACDIFFYYIRQFENLFYIELIAHNKATHNNQFVTCIK